MTTFPSMIKWLQIVAICYLFGTCQQLTDDSLEALQEGTLHVRTRSSSVSGLAYPVSLYAFSEKGDCAASQVIRSEDESVKLDLPVGKYRMVAIAGYSEGYEIPSVLSLDDRIIMQDEKGAATPLMMGKADVAVGADKECKVELLLFYVVSSMDVVLSNVPSDVKAVKVILSSFHSSMDMDGEYVDSDCSLELDCSLDAENQWSSQTRYVFPGNGSQTTLSIVLELEDGEETTYGYVWKDVPQSGQPYCLRGEYSGSYSLSGTFIVSGWNEMEEVEFEFGSTSSPDDGDEDEDEEDAGTDLSSLPEVGSIWNGTIVADVIETDESGVEVLLMSLEEWEVTVSQVEDAIAGYSVNGILDWRLPTHEDAAALRERFSGDDRLDLNETIAGYKSGLRGLANGKEERYLCSKNGVISSFQFVTGTDIRKAGNVRSYYVRLVKNYRIES